MKKNLDLKGYEYPEKLSSREKTALVVIVIVMIAFTLTSCIGSSTTCHRRYIQEPGTCHRRYIQEPGKGW